MADPERAELLRTIRAAHGQELLRYVLRLTRGDVEFAEGVVPVADIAADEGVPEGTVKSRLHYALRALRLVLQENGVDTDTGRKRHTAGS